MNEAVIRELDDGQIREIYRQRILKDFKRDEIKPLSVILKTKKEGHYLGLGLTEGEEITAYAFFVTLSECALLDYYAVREDLRSRGTGSRFLQALIAGPLQTAPCVLVETEDPAAAQSDKERTTHQRRLRFYLKNGLLDTGVTSCVWHVNYRLLAFPTGRTPSPDEVRRHYASLYHTTMPDFLFARLVRIE